jgi:hypothetical protein
MIREPLDDPPAVPLQPKATIADLEVRYLRALMQRDAKIWAARTGYELGGVIEEPDEVQAGKQQDRVNRENGHAAPLDSPTAWTGSLGTRGWID